MSNFYNSTIKDRFINENNFSEAQIDKWNIIFSKTKPQEEMLKKDIFQMNKEECEDLLHLFKLRSVQYVNMHITNLKYYIYWCDNQGLIPHHINYFEGLGDRETAKKFVSNQATENQIISKEKLNLYIEELQAVGDYQGALILYLLFSGVTLDPNDKKCELRHIKVSDLSVKDNVTLQTRRRILNIEDSSLELILNAIKQKEMIDLLSIDEMGTYSRQSKDFNNQRFLIKWRRRGFYEGTLTPYFNITKKIREMGTYLNNPYLNASYLNLSGLIDYVKNNYTDYDDVEMYEELINIFKLDISKKSLKQKILPFLK